MSEAHPDKKIQDLYHKLKNIKGKGIDFEKKKKYKPFIPANFKYANVPNHKTCWHCGMSRHICPLCPQREYLWTKVSSNVKTSV